MKNNLVKKPKSFKQEWLRASEIADRYPIGKSTVWDWAKKGKLTPIKVSAGTTVFAREELENLFKLNSLKSKKVPTKAKKVRRRKKARAFKRQEPQSIPKSKHTDKEMIEDYIKKHVKPFVEFEEWDYDKVPHLRRRKKLPPAKEGVMGANKNIIEKMKNKRNANV